MNFLKGFLTLLLIIVTIIAVFFPVAVFVHETTHYLMYTLEGMEVTSFHMLDRGSLESGRFGYITISKNSGCGSLVHEGVAYSFQCLFMLTTAFFCLVNPLKPFTVRQLDLMGAKRNSHHSTKT